MEDLAGGVDAQNLADAINGPLFEQIGQNWTQDYLVKLFNNATDTLDITSVADYETANDENDLRQDINVEIIVWDDVNGDGILDGGEEGVSTGKKSIVKWKTEGFDITSIEPGNTLGLIVRFSVENLSDTKQGAQITFDFEFNATAQE